MTTITANTVYAVGTNGTAAFTLAAGGALTSSFINGSGLLIDGGSSPLTITGGAITVSFGLLLTLGLGGMIVAAKHRKAAAAG